MADKAQVLELIIQQGILPLFFNKDTQVSVDVLRALYQAGVRTVEYTNRGDTALKNFTELKKVCDEDLKGMILGVGTIKTADSAQAFIDAGADYIISPGLVEDAARVAENQKMLWVPGCMTPTEIIKAESMGAKLVKLFPGNLLGPAFLSSVKELFPGMLFMPTGGVELEETNIRNWFAAGVCAVGMGSKLISKEVMNNKQYDKLVSSTQSALAMVKSFNK